MEHSHPRRGGCRDDGMRRGNSECANLSISDEAFGHLSAVAAHAIAAIADLPVIAALADLSVVAALAEFPDVAAIVIVVVEQFLLVVLL